MMSRNDLPSRTGSSDLALSMPIEVPSPPLSLMITVLARAAEASASLTSTSVEQVGIGERLDRVLGDEAGDALLQLTVVVAEDVDGLLRHTGVRHLLGGEGESLVTHGLDPRERTFHEVTTVPRSAGVHLVFGLGVSDASSWIVACWICACASSREIVGVPSPGWSP